MSYVYPVPDYRVSNSIRGSHQQPMGPFPLVTAAGYGNPGSYVAGTLQNTKLAQQKGQVLIYEVLPNDPSKLWKLNKPVVVYASDNVDDFRDYPKKSMVQSSSFGNVESSNSGYSSYEGMDSRTQPPAYGKYLRD